MDLINKKLLIVFCGDKFKSLLSIGDIQRAIISNIPLDTPVSEVVRKNVTVGYTNQSAEEIKALMLKFRRNFAQLSIFQEVLLVLSCGRIFFIIKFSFLKRNLIYLLLLWQVDRELG